MGPYACYPHKSYCYLKNISIITHIFPPKNIKSIQRLFNFISCKDILWSVQLCKLCCSLLAVVSHWVSLTAVLKSYPCPEILGSEEMDPASIHSFHTRVTSEEIKNHLNGNKRARQELNSCHTIVILIKSGKLCIGSIANRQRGL